ncbi:P-loop NTPase fold protein [Paraburkholderia sp. MM5477-R1]|uniref:P-loop NTPase fold protein n=1 Tax=Paraburkholderia sp. MM5477-R1 TaxID=2991062 RepID=UPI003D23DADC
MGYQTEKLLDDEPSETDQLGPHELIAAAIAEVVRCQSGGKTIRLDGEWGAGKSTVVRLLGKKLVDRDTTMFVYDAWVHVGDPLRRVFLDSLLDTLERKTWLGPNAARWEKRRATLAGRFKVTVERKKPTLNVFARLTPWAAWSLPLLFWVAQKFFDTPVTWLSGMGIGPRFALFAALTSISLAIWLSLKEESVAFLLTRTPLEFTSEKEDEPTATSIEFQKFFSDLMIEALGEEDGRRKLLIVVDNLDRVGAEETNDVWALLRSFLDNPAFQSQPWFRRVWVLVPVAKQIGVSSNSDELAEESVSNPLTSFTQSANPKSVFLDKVFQVKFELPPPSLKRWTEFLRKLCRAAFVNSSLDADAIVRLYVNETGGRAPSPRDLVRFVNDLVGLRLQWGEQFSLTELAAFTLSGARDKVVMQVQQGQRPWERFEALMGLPRGKFKPAFRTLCLSVGNATAAMTSEYRTQIRDALFEGRADDVVVALREEGAGWVLDSLISELRTLYSTPEQLMNAFIVLREVSSQVKDRDSTIAEALPITFVHDVDGACRQAMKSLTRHDYAATNVPDGFAAYVEIVGNADAGQTVLDSIACADAVSNVIDFEENFLAILSVPTISNALLAASSPLELPISGEQWLELRYKRVSGPYVRPEAREFIESHLKKCMPRSGWSNVEDALEERIRAHKVDEVTRAALEDLSEYSVKAMLNALLHSVGRYLSGDDEFRGAISVLRGIAKRQGVVSLRLALADHQLQPFLLDEIASGWWDDNSRAFLLLLTVAKMSEKTLDERGGKGIQYIFGILKNPYANEYIRFVNVLATEINENSCLGVLSDLAIHWSDSRPFVRCVISRIKADDLFFLLEQVSSEQDMPTFLNAILGDDLAERVLRQYDSFMAEIAVWEPDGPPPSVYDLGI